MYSCLLLEDRFVGIIDWWLVNKIGCKVIFPQVVQCSHGLNPESPQRYQVRAVPIRGKLYAWGGRTQEFSEIGRQKMKSVLETFDLHVEVWVQKGTSGSPPPGVCNGACADIGDSMYVSCGHDGSNKYQKLCTS